MTNQDKTKVISSIAFFQSLSPNDLQIIAQSTQEKIIPSQTVFIEQDDKSDGVYFLVEGGVKVYRVTEDGEIINLAILGPGELIGEMALIDDEPRSASVETIQDSKMLILTKKDFGILIAKHSQIAIEIMRILTKRMRTLNEYVEDVLSKNLYERTWKTLKAISNYFPDQIITLSQEELSDIIGATRARVTETLNQLQKENKINLSHRKIQVN